MVFEVKREKDIDICCQSSETGMYKEKMNNRVKAIITVRILFQPDAIRFDRKERKNA